MFWPLTEPQQKRSHQQLCCLQVNKQLPSSANGDLNQAGALAELLLRRVLQRLTYSVHTEIRLTRLHSRLSRYTSVSLGCSRDFCRKTLPLCISLQKTKGKKPRDFRIEAQYLVNPLNNYSWTELTASFLVGLVPTVVNPITFPKLSFALSVFTLQLRGVTLCRKKCMLPGINIDFRYCPDCGDAQTPVCRLVAADMNVWLHSRQLSSSLLSPQSFQPSHCRVWLMHRLL